MKVVVVGGGLIGLAVAWRAALAGLDVTVADDAAGQGASLAAAGMLAPVTEAAYGESALLALNRASLARWPAFAAELEQASGADVGLRSAGTLVVGFDAGDAAALQEQQRWSQEQGLPVHRLTPSACRRLEPGLTPRLRAALDVPSDAAVAPRLVHAALTTAARRAGVHREPQRVPGLLVADGRVTGVRLADGSRLAADAVVLAAGAHSAQLADGLVGQVPGLAAGAVPVRPVKGQILRLRGPAPLLTRTVRALVRGRGVYLVPDDRGGLVVGATSEERGFDPTVTAGAVLELLSDAAEVLPGVTELELLETLARWRPGTPDNAPLLGAGLAPGLVLATGHFRHGALLTPVTADAVVRVLTGDGLPAVAAPFAADRFAAPGAAPAMVGAVPCG